MGHCILWHEGTRTCTNYNYPSYLKPILCPYYTHLSQDIPATITHHTCTLKKPILYPLIIPRHSSYNHTLRPYCTHLSQDIPATITCHTLRPYYTHLYQDIPSSIIPYAHIIPIYTQVHSSCRSQFPAKCPLGQCRLSLLPPISLNSMSSDGYWQATRQGCCSPLLVFVNSKSGDNQGVKFLRRFKQLLNPAQVFDLMNSGPHIG